MLLFRSKSFYDPKPCKEMHLEDKHLRVMTTPSKDIKIMAHNELVNTKQTEITGGDVNYYLVIILHADGTSTIVEIEDIIEAVNMSFAAGNVFKAMVRICKLRMDLGKPGSSALYEAEKAFYYAKRTLVVSQRRWKTLRSFSGFLFSSVPIFTTIAIPDPKRLAPYTFEIHDFVKALNPTHHEAEVLTYILKLSLMREKLRFPREREVRIAELVVEAARRIESREQLAKKEDKGKKDLL